VSRGVVKSKAKFFRDRAADCARLAAVAKDERARAMLIHMAAAWVWLAESLEKTLEPTKEGLVGTSPLQSRIPARFSSSENSRLRASPSITLRKPSNKASNMPPCRACKSFDFLAKFLGTTLSERDANRSHLDRGRPRPVSL
jgi:hypothetical protein